MSVVEAKSRRNGSGKTGVATRNSLADRFSAARGRLTGRRLQMIRAILENPEETVFLSCRKMAKRHGVDAATVLRTIQALGYDNFADFAGDLRNHFVTQITPYRVMRAATREHKTLHDQIVNVVNHDADNVAALRSSLDTTRVMKLASAIQRARRVVVVGVDLAASLAWFLAYALAPLGIDAEAPVGSSGSLQHKIKLLTNKDLLLAISFGRCLRETVDSALLARERSVPTFGITDGDVTPIARYCDNYLVASISSSCFSGSYAAPMSLINCIVLACAHTDPPRSLERLRKIERDYATSSRWYRDAENKSGSASRPRDG
jgi:DNA-binding MurR/RpiR family transcriptional regulator